MIALSLRWYVRKGRTRPPAHVFAVCFFTRSASASTCSYGRHPSVQCESERVGGLLQLPTGCTGPWRVRPRTSGSWQRREPEPHRRPENLQTAPWRV